MSILEKLTLIFHVYLPFADTHIVKTFRHGRHLRTEDSNLRHNPCFLDPACFLLRRRCRWSTLWPCNSHNPFNSLRRFFRFRLCHHLRSINSHRHRHLILLLHLYIHILLPIRPPRHTNAQQPSLHFLILRRSPHRMVFWPP